MGVMHTPFLCAARFEDDNYRSGRLFRANIVAKIESGSNNGGYVPLSTPVILTFGSILASRVCL